MLSPYPQPPPNPLSRLASDLGHPAYDGFTLALAPFRSNIPSSPRPAFCDIVRKHPYLSDRVVHVESLRRRERQKGIEYAVAVIP